MSLLADTGVVSAALSRRLRPWFEPLLARLPGNQLYLASQPAAELRPGALIAGWSRGRLGRLEQALGSMAVAPVSDALLGAVARFRFECRAVGHPLAQPVHHDDLWMGATAVHLGLPLLAADGVFAHAPALLF